jgi:hypothetical protein
MLPMSASIRLRLLTCAAALVVGTAPALQAQTAPGTGVTVTGGAAPGATRVPDGQIEFNIRVPLRPNAENVLTLTAADGTGRTATVPNLSVTQLTLTDIVRARVTSQRLTPQEVRALVAEGTINLADPDNYHVSRFVVALTVEGREVQVSVPVIRRENFEFGAGEPISIGCSSGNSIQSTERAIAIPCGNGGSDGPPPPPIIMIPFEAVADVPGQPTIPGVILIEGRIKTLKEFYKITLYLMNVSSIFTLTDIEATLELPEGALTHVAPASGLVRIDTLEPGEEGSGEFIVRGDEIGTHAVTAHFGGRLTSPFLSEPVPIAGSASTDVVVKGPPQLAVKLSHPDYVVAGTPYDLIVEITNTDTELDALYASLALDVGHDAYIIDETTGERADSPVDRSLGDIMRGERRVNRYRVMPLVTGAIASCTAAASQNLQLTIGFTGRSGGPVCAIGTLPAQRTSPDGKPTVTVIPTHNTTGVALNPAIVALFSAPMITQTITTGYPEATFKVIDQAGNIVPGTLSFGVLFDATSAVFRPATPFQPEQTYSIVVESGIFSEEGLSLASGSLSRFITGTPPPPPDNQPPQVTLAVEAPLSATSIPRGQVVGVAAQVTDNIGFTRIELYLDGVLVDTKRPGTNLRFLVDTAGLAAGSSHEVRAIALDPIGNQGHQILTLQIAGDSTAPVASLVVPPAIGRGGALDVTVNATDDGRVARVDLYLDSSAEPLWTGLVEPFRTTLDTATFAPGARRLRAVVVDGAGNQTSAEAMVNVTADLTPPIVAFVRPLGGVEVRRGALLQAIVSAADDHGVASIAIYLDGELTPRSTGASGLAIDTATLALGPHQLRARAVDTAGNAAESVAAFTLVTVPSDEVAPGAPLAALITPTPGTTGLVTLTGAPGAAEGLTLLSVVNVETRAAADAFVAANGSFTVNVEASAGETLALVAIDAAENRSQETRIRVPEPLRLTSFVVTPSPITLDRNTRSVQLSVTGAYSDGATAPVPVTNLFYSSTTPAVASVTTDGLVLAGINGTTTINVGVFEPSGLPTMAVPVTTSFPTITSVTVTPGEITLAGAGTTQRITVIANLSDGATEPFSSRVQYGSQNVTVAVVDSTGLVRGLSNGETTITVVPTGFPAVTVPVTITNRQPTELLVSPNTLLLSGAGQSVSVVASLRYNDGSTSLAPNATFTALDSAVASVEANGLVTAVAEGLTTIVVASSGFTVNVPVTVDFPSQLPAPILTSLGRQIAGEGDTLVILGSYFSALAFDNDVTISGVAAEVLRAANDRLVVRVPRGAVTGPVQVVVDGQTSNLLTIPIYPRSATATSLTGAFNVPTPTQGQSIVMGPVTIDVRAGDSVRLSGHAETVAGRQFSTIPGPAFTGTLMLTIDGVPTMISPSPTPIDLTSQLSAGEHTISAELTATGGSLSSQGLAVLSGPPNTGVFIGAWSLTGDGVPATKTVRFTQLTTLAGQPIPNGTVLGVRGDSWYRVTDGGCCNSAPDGGVIVNGTVSPTNGDLKLIAVENGGLTVQYSDSGLVVPFGTTRTGVISVLEMNGTNYASSRPIAAAGIYLGALESASVIPDQTSALADGVDRPFTVEVNSVRDNLGNRVPDGVGFGLTADNYYRLSDGGCCNNSAGGEITGGETVTNDNDFRAFTLVNGSATGLYSSSTLALSTTDVRTAKIVAILVNAARARQGSHPFAEGSVTLSGVAFGTATGSALPTSLAATGADARSVITIRNLVDAGGRPLPNGARISVTAANWYRVGDGGCCNNSEGGSIVSGTVDPGDGRFRVHTVQNGQVVLTYSNAGIVLGPNQTATALISALPASVNGNIGTRPFLAVPVTLAGISNATVTPAISSTPADGVARPITVTVSNIVDALGLPVPDGTKVGLTAANWYRVTDGGCCNNSHGGAFTDGETSPSDGRFRVYTVTNGSFTATFSAASAPLVGSFGSATTFLSPIVATPTNGLPLTRPFAVGAIALTNGANGTITATPSTLLGDTADRRSTIEIGSLVDAQGRPLPDGTKVALTAANWYRLADGGCCNGSFGGTIVDGTTSSSDGRFKWFSVLNGSVTATFSNVGLAREAHQTETSIVSVMPADGNGNPIGSRPMLSTPVTIVGLGSGLFSAPATLLPGATTTVTLSNISDHTGAIVPDGTRIAVTSINWYRASDGGCCNGSNPGTLPGTVTPNDGSFRTLTVTGGSVTFNFTAPGTNNVTSVISAVSAGPTGNRVGQTPFAAVAIRATTTP